MNNIHTKKLLNSKWTAVTPHNREKHFLITSMEYDDDSNVIACEIEAVMIKRTQQIDWRDLKDSSLWLSGWQ